MFRRNFDLVRILRQLLGTPVNHAPRVVQSLTIYRSFASARQQIDRSSVQNSSRKSVRQPYVWMPRPCCVASCTPRRSSSEVLWITDDILADAFRRFTSVYVRHGSNVPGPLEFRKRANRRKNTNLAQISAPSAIDPAILFATKAEKSWWASNTVEASSASVKQSGSAVLSWLFEDTDQNEANQSATTPCQGLHGDSQTSTAQSDRADESSHSQKLPDHLDRKLIPRHSPASATFETTSTLSQTDRLRSSRQFGVVEEPTPTQTTAIELSRSNDSPKLLSKRSDSFMLRHSAPPRHHEELESFDFEADLLRCHSVEDLEVLLRTHRIDILFDQKRRLSVLEQTQTWSVVEFAKYLTHPQFQSSASGRLGRLAQRLCENSSKSEIFMHQHGGWFTAFGAICQAVRSGCVSANEWTQIMDGVMSCLTSTKSRNSTAATATVKDLVLSYEQCPTLSVSSLNHMWLQNFVNILKQHSDYLPVLETLWRVHQWQPGRDVAAMAQVYASWLRLLPQVRLADEPTRLLIDLPRDLALQVIGRISVQVLAPYNEHMSSSTQKQKWLNVVGAFEKLGAGAKSMTLSDAMNLKLGISSNLPQIVQLTTFLWIFHKLCRRQGTVGDLAQSWSLSDVFDLHEILPEGQEIRLYNQILAKAKTMTIAQDTTLVEELPSLLARLKVSTRASPTSCLSAVVQTNLLELMHNQKYMEACKNHSERFTELVQALNLHLDTFQQLIRTLVDTNKLNFRFITRTLSNNRHFRTALARSWPSQSSPSSEARLFLDVDPKQALDTIHIFAVACAISPAVSPRQALTKVKWCRNFLLDCRAPVEAPITRALWHAGVTRYGDGCSDKKLRWILRQVVKVEGAHVAKLLLKSADFRQHRAAVIQMMDLYAEQPQERETTPTMLRQGLQQSYLPSKTVSKISTLPLEVARIASFIESQAIALDQQERRELEENAQAQKASSLRRSRDLDFIQRETNADSLQTVVRNSRVRNSISRTEEGHSGLPMRRVVSNVQAPVRAPAKKNALQVENAPQSPGVGERLGIGEYKLAREAEIVLESDSFYAGEAYDEHKRAAARGNWTWQAKGMGSIANLASIEEAPPSVSQQVHDHSEMEFWLQKHTEQSHTKTSLAKTVGEVNQGPGTIADPETASYRGPAFEAWMEEYEEPVHTALSLTQNTSGHESKIKSVMESDKPAEAVVRSTSNSMPPPETETCSNTEWPRNDSAVARSRSGHGEDCVDQATGPPTAAQVTNAATPSDLSSQSKYLDLSAMAEPVMPLMNSIQPCGTNQQEERENTAAVLPKMSWAIDETKPGRYNWTRQWVSLRPSPTTSVEEDYT